jgi:hypothetical protein
VGHSLGIFDIARFSIRARQARSQALNRGGGSLRRQFRRCWFTGARLGSRLGENGAPRRGWHGRLDLSWDGDLNWGLDRRLHWKLAWSAWQSLLGCLRLEGRAGAGAGPQRFGNPGQLIDGRGQADQDQARRSGSGPGDDHCIAEIEFVDRNPKTDRDDARHGDQDTQYKQDYRHTGTPGSARLSLRQPPAMVSKEFCPPSSAIAMTNPGRNNPNLILINVVWARRYGRRPTPIGDASKARWECWR